MPLREKMRPYVKQLMMEAHEKGTPIMRPLFYDFPQDSKAWEIEDQYMFGPDLLVSPILEAGMTERTLYLPEGSWRNINDGTIFEGDRMVTVATQLMNFRYLQKPEQEKNYKKEGQRVEPAVLTGNRRQAE